MFSPLGTVCHKCFPIVEQERILPNSFDKANIILISKSDKDMTREENHWSLLNMDAKIRNKNTSKRNPPTYNKNYIHHGQEGSTSGMKDWFNVRTSINTVHHLTRIKKENRIIISTYTEKAFDKIQYPWVIKTLNKLDIEGNFLNLKRKATKNP